MSDKPAAGLWRNNPDTPEGKYLVQRRDGTVVEWPNFVIGAKDPCAPRALRAYAEEAIDRQFDHQYISDIFALAAQFEEYRETHGDGDPDRGRHRADDPATIAKMRSERADLYQQSLNDAARHVCLMYSPEESRQIAKAILREIGDPQ